MLFLIAMAQVVGSEARGGVCVVLAWSAWLLEELGICLLHFLVPP